MRIMVCDDEMYDRGELVQSVKAVWPEARIDVAGSGQEVIRSIQKGTGYDLIFLDIYMDNVDGIQAGKWIHENFPELKMVFVSNSRDFGPELFAVNALHYLVKPWEQKDMEEIRRRFEESARKNAVLHTGIRETEEIPFQRISYIDSDHNNLHIHLLNGSILTVRDSIQRFMEKLDERFLRINRGVIVNMEAVEKMNTQSCEIAGVTFMLSRKTRAESRKKYNDYMFEAAMRIT